MKQNRRHTVRRVLRRAAALFLATIAVWLLALTVNFGAAAEVFRSLGKNPGFVSAALRAELGEISAGKEALSTMNTWQKLVLSQSPLLSSGKEVVASPLVQEETILPESPAPVEPDDPEDSDEVIAVTETQDNIIERTLTAGNQENYDSAAGVYIFNRTSQQVDVAALAAAKVSIDLGDSGQPQVLIVHTHGSEAYAQQGGDLYTETDTARTTDENFNVIRIGEEMARIFTELGLNVIHDHTLYDYPVYSGSYDRSKEAVEGYLAKYPSIKIVLDVHRDALIATDGTVYKAVTTIDGVKTAQVLLVVGSDDGGFEHPQWRENLTLAVKIQQAMNSLWPTLARPITLRPSRFNQQLTTGSLLVEIGCHGNTLQEALAGARLFARASGQVLLPLK